MKKGFTLIELLVVIAIIGVMMAAVIVAINPTARLKDARDSNGKQVTAEVAVAAEACIVKGLGSALTEAAAIAACDTTAELVTLGFLKQVPTGLGGTLAMAAEGTTGVCVSYDLEANDTGCLYWKYLSTTGTTPGKAACAALGC